MTLNKDAIFIADAHDNKGRKVLLQALKEVEKKSPSQLFLVGDIFDLLVGEVAYTHTFYKTEIAFINLLSQSIEIYYFEGNHDFQIKHIFPNVQVFTLKQQPIFFQQEDKKVAIAHGDTYEGLGYNLYTSIIRNHYLLLVLNYIDARIKYRISKAILEKLAYKTQCRTYENFEKYIDKRLTFYPRADLIIEGHFHQNKVYKNYINLPSLACQKELFRLY